MKRKISIIMFIIGICLLIYPILANSIYKITQTVAITNYSKQISNMTTENKQELKDEYKKYNKDIYEKATSSIDLLKKGDVIGYLRIEKISVNLAIYEGTSESVLTQGIGHLENTSLPGEKNTHCVLAAHSGLSKAKLFDDLDKLEVGDNFEVTMLDNTYLYEVDQIKTVKKDNIEDLKIEQEKEYVTLVTCTPKYINSHRLLVRGKRIYDENDYYKSTRTNIVNKYNNEIIYIDINPVLIVLIFSLIIIIFFIKLIFRKKDVIVIRQK